MKLSPRIIIIVLLLILLLGAGLRFYRLGAEDLWLDEILTIKFASIPWSDLKLGHLDSDAITHFLGDYFIMHLWLKLGGTAIIIRLFSVLIGIVTILVMFFLTCRLFNRSIALLSTLFLAVSSYHIYYSQEARVYVLQVLLILLMVYFFYRGLEEHKTRFWVIFSIISIFSIYLQAFSLFSLIALNLYFIIKLYFRGKTIRILPWLISQGIIFLCCLPYFIYLIRPSVYVERLSWIPKPTVHDIENTLELFSVGRTFWVLPEYLRKLIVPLFLFFVILSFIFLINSIRKKAIWSDRNSSVLLTWSLLIIPIILFYGISLKRPIFVADRYLIISLPFFYLTIAHGISKLEYRTMKNITVTILVSGMLIGLYAHYHEPTKIRWSQVALYLEQNAKQNDPILIYPDYPATSLSYYLKTPISLIGFSDIQKIHEVTTDHPKVWLVSVSYGENQLPLEFRTKLNTLYHQWQTVFTLSKPAKVDITLLSNPVYQIVAPKEKY